MEGQIIFTKLSDFELFLFRDNFMLNFMSFIIWREIVWNFKICLFK